MRIAVALLVLTVAVYLVVRLGLRRLGGVAAPPPPRVRDAAAEEAFRRAVRERAERQRRGIPEPEPAPAPPLVDMDDDVFGQDPYGRGDHESFVVITQASTATAVAAVDRANARFMLVDENGREHADHDALDAAFDAHDGGDDLYTPNYTATPRVTGAGVEGYVDCKGAITPEMGHTFRRVLHEELARLGVPVRVVVRSRD